VKPWTYAEQEALRILSPLGGPACALAFDRSHGSIRHRASALGISLKRRSYGTKLGQCSQAALRKVKEYSEASLCPSCAKRPIAVAKTGLCGACHLDGLRTVHEAEIATADSQRRLWSSRAMLMRRRRSLAAAESLDAADSGDGGGTMVVQDAPKLGVQDHYGGRNCIRRGYKFKPLFHRRK